jgi:glutamine amidotransferase PdxT
MKAVCWCGTKDIRVEHVPDPKLINPRDAVYLPGGDAVLKSLANDTKAIEFIEEAYKHWKAIAATGSGVELLQKTRAGGVPADKPSKGGSVPKV